ncbi:MAG TPA: hypothetical protein VNI77_06280 [Nitrososphaera sp.]|nr:hypothetical protein [Nitrososphaera sp.]
MKSVPGSLSLLLVVATLFLLVFIPVAISPVYAHFDHLAHYNSRGAGVGQYYVYAALEPDYASPGEPTAIMFSVQDGNGQDTYNIETMVEIYASSGDRIKAFPWTKRDVGDFEVFYTFPQVGSYQVVLSIADGPVNTNAIDPPRTALSSVTGCNCERVLFNFAISEGFGLVFNSTLAGAVFGSLGIFGAVLGVTYWSKKKNGEFASGAGDVARYIVTLAAIAGGLVHFAVYSGHASLRIEYSIFLIMAGGMQVAYGILYTLITLTGATSGKTSPRRHYRKTVEVNLFGLIGTAVLLGLYAYSVILPPPLSPTGKPEHVDVAGVLAKSVEVFTLIGILYLMRLEKRRLAEFLKERA